MRLRDQIEAARARGHRLTVTKRGPWPQHGDPHPKWNIACTCGWESATRRSEKAVVEAVIWHVAR